MSSNIIVGSLGIVGISVFILYFLNEIKKMIKDVK